MRFQNGWSIKAPECLAARIPHHWIASLTERLNTYATLLLASLFHMLSRFLRYSHYLLSYPEPKRIVAAQPFLRLSPTITHMIVSPKYLPDYGPKLQGFEGGLCLRSLWRQYIRGQLCDSRCSCASQGLPQRMLRWHRNVDSLPAVVHPSVTPCLVRQERYPCAHRRLPP